MADLHLFAASLTKVIWAFVGVFLAGLFAIYVVVCVWVYGFIPSLISSIMHQLK